MPAVPRVIISGAGIAGLAAAVRLARIGWQPLVIERAPARRGAGYLINIAGDGLAAAERIGVLPALRRNHLDLRRFAYFTPRGRRRFTVGNAAVRALLGPGHVALMRGDLEAVLYDSARDLAGFRFGTTIRSVAQEPGGVHVTLDDGTTLDAELLIGADGLHSGIRELVFASEPVVRNDLGILVAAFLPEQVTPELDERTVATIFAPNRTVALVRLRSGRAAALFTCRSAAAVDDLADPRAAIAGVFPDLDWLMPDLRGQLDRAGSVYADTASQVDLDRWSSGRIVLLGDAAWCLSLFAGSGASMAMTGADLLATLVEEASDLASALSAWEAELRPLIAQRQRSARRNAAHLNPRGRLQIWLGQLPIRLASVPAVTRFAAPLLARRHPVSTSNTRRTRR